MIRSGWAPSWLSATKILSNTPVGHPHQLAGQIRSIRDIGEEEPQRRDTTSKSQVSRLCEEIDARVAVKGVCAKQSSFFADAGSYAGYRVVYAVDARWFTAG